MPFVESSEYLLGGDGACLDGVAGHGLKAMVEGFAAFGERRGRGSGPGGPRGV